MCSEGGWRIPVETSAILFYCLIVWLELRIFVDNNAYKFLSLYFITSSRNKQFLHFKATAVVSNSATVLRTELGKTFEFNCSFRHSF